MEEMLGRPPMNLKPLLVRVPEGTAERIDEIAGANRRGEFVREAIEREIKRRQAKPPKSK